MSCMVTICDQKWVLTHTRRCMQNSDDALHTMIWYKLLPCNWWVALQYAWLTTHAIRSKPAAKNLLDIATYWISPRLVNCQRLDVDPCWWLPLLGYHYLMDITTCWGMPHPGECHFQCIADSWRLNLLGYWQFLNIASFWRLPLLGDCRFLYIPDS